MENLKYPIGKYVKPRIFNEQINSKNISDIKKIPQELKNAVQNLSEEQLNTAYREGGWTVRQLVHHIADSHINSYVRFKLALTENETTIKTYDQEKWAELPDTFNTPIEISLTLLETLHTRWVNLLNALSQNQMKKKYINPDLGYLTIEETIALYAWHSNHHLAHIINLIDRMGW